MNTTQENELLTTEYEAEANFLEKDGKVYLFFDEENDDGEMTKCRFEISDDTLRLRRNGPIVIEQTHINGKITSGYLKTPFGHVDTKLKTSHFSFTEQAAKHYQLELDYDLYMNNEQEKIGSYTLKIIIT